MRKTEVLDLISNQENSRVEFKRDDVHTDSLAKEMSALLNLEGGTILLGVDADGGVSGLSRSVSQAEEWVMNIAQNNVQPSVVPVWSTVSLEGGTTIGIVELPADSPGKPYKARRGGSWVAFTRVGSTSREATREEEARLYQAAALVRYEIKGVPDTGHGDLDLERVENYFRVVLQRPSPKIEETESWQQLLFNSDVMVRLGDELVLSVTGLLLFGSNPNRRLPQSGVTAVAFPEKNKDYNTIDEDRIRGPLVSRVSSRGTTLESGVIERTVDFVRRNMGSVAWLDGARRRRKEAFPSIAIREAVVNAVAHRDYSLEGTDIEVSLYKDRLEVISPGRLPNGVTVEKMKEGVVRVARNGLLKEILRDYKYIEHFGMGVRDRIIESMRQHNGTEPDLVEEDNRFIVRLWKQ